MTPKENLLRVIRHDRPEYVPLGLGDTLREITFETVEWPDEPGLDAWGVRWDIASKEVGAYPVEHPLTNLDKLDDLVMPDFTAAPYQKVAREWMAERGMGSLPVRVPPMSGTGVSPVSGCDADVPSACPAGILPASERDESVSPSSGVIGQEQQKQRNGKDAGGTPARHADKMSASHAEFMLMGRVGETLFERAWMLMGMEGLMIAFYESPDKLHELFGRIAQVRRQQLERHIAARLEAVMFADDYGGQEGMLISPTLWRQFIKPHLAPLYARAKEAGMMVFQHSCGDNGPILGDLVEMGLDVWHPCQPTSNDLPALKAKFAGRLAFYGAVNSYVLDRGTPEDVRAEVRLRIAQLARGGGYIAAPSHGVPYKKENLDALADEVARGGRYVPGADEPGPGDSRP